MNDPRSYCSDVYRVKVMFSGSAQFLAAVLSLVEYSMSKFNYCFETQKGFSQVHFHPICFEIGNAPRHCIISMVHHIRANRERVHCIY